MKRLPQWHTCSLSALLTTSGGGPELRVRERGVAIGPSLSKEYEKFSPGKVTLGEGRSWRPGIFGVIGERDTGDASELILFDIGIPPA